MVREFSAGGVVVRRMRGHWWVAAIEPRRDKPSSKTTVALPKGLVDQGEKPEQTAIREVLEETGVQAEVVTKLSDIKYFYVRSWGDRQRVFKIVSFYLLLYRTGKIGEIKPEMQHEVLRAVWLPLEDAPEQLSYRGERDVARLALKYLQEHPELG